MTQNELNQFIAVFMYGMADGKCEFHHKLPNKDGDIEQYQMVRIAVMEKDCYDSLEEIFCNSKEKYPHLVSYFHCDRMQELKPEFEEGLKTFIDEYHPDVTMDHKKNELLVKITTSTKNKIKISLLNDIMEKKEQLQYMNESIEKMIALLVQEMKMLANHVSFETFFARLHHDEDKPQKKECQFKIGM